MKALKTSGPPGETRGWAAPSLDKVAGETGVGTITLPQTIGETRGWACIKLAAQLRRRAGRLPIALRARAAAAPGSLLSRLRRSL